MLSNRRLLAGAIPVTLLIGSSGAILLASGVSRPVVAGGTAQKVAQQRDVALSLEGAFIHVSETVGPATVSITVSPEESGASAAHTSAPPSSKKGADDDEDFQFQGPRRRSETRGSGVIVRSDGYILTNDHIVEEAPNNVVKVTLADDTSYVGKVFRDPKSDLSVVKIEAPKPLPFVHLADSKGIRVGQWAVAIGSPFGQQNTMTAGIVSALHRRKEIADGGLPRLYTNLIQTDASINPGNSGGPLLNINGELIGINVAIFSPTGTSLGIGYAIPANTARHVMEDLIANGKVTRSSLGVIPEDVPPGLRSRLKIEHGAYIKELMPDTPADKAGLTAGDVIVRFGDQTIDGEDSLREAIATTHPKTTVPIVIIHHGQEKTVSATVVQSQEAMLPDSATTVPAPPRRTPESLGFETGPVPAELTAFVKQATNPIEGVAITRVRRGSPASQAGLPTGALIYEVDGAPVTTADALKQALAATKSGETISLLVYRFEADARPIRAAVNIVVP